MMMLRAAALALLAEAKVVRETLYRITPRNYTGVTDLDTGDAAGQPVVTSTAPAPVERSTIG